MVNKIMAITSVIEQMRQLIQLIAKHNHAYYVMDQPTISDSEYDHLFHQLKALEEQYPELVQADSPTTKVGGQALSKFESVTHVVPMLSLGNVFNQEDLFAFARRVEERLPNQKVQYEVELKLDGLAISLWYENGVLVRGVTRGMVKLAKILLKTLKPFVTYLKFCIQKNTKFRACSKYGVKYSCRSLVLKTQCRSGSKGENLR